MALCYLKEHAKQNNKLTQNFIFFEEVQYFQYLIIAYIFTYEFSYQKKKIELEIDDKKIVKQLEQKRQSYR